LPDERLIKLQWFLTRVLRMSGAAEAKDIEEPGDDSPMASRASSCIESPAASVPKFPLTSPTLPYKPLSTIKQSLKQQPRRSSRDTILKLPKPRWPLSNFAQRPTYRIPFRRQKELDARKPVMDDRGMADQCSIHLS